MPIRAKNASALRRPSPSPMDVCTMKSDKYVSPLFSEHGTEAHLRGVVVLDPQTVEWRA